MVGRRRSSENFKRASREDNNTSRESGEVYGDILRSDNTLPVVGAHANVGAKKRTDRPQSGCSRIMPEAIYEAILHSRQSLVRSLCTCSLRWSPDSNRASRFD